jgi:PKD repeat protein
VCSGLALWSACDSAIPTAPSGTVLTISANPSQISLDGTSQIVVIGRRPDGNPLNEGTEVFFTTNLGNLTPAFATVDEDGVARATLRGDGRVGTASVTARVSTATAGGEMSAGTGSASVDVVIGNPSSPTGSTLTISAEPTQIPLGGASTITVIARRPDGNPLNAGTEVFFTTNLGSVSPAVATTNSSGVATTTLRAENRVGTAMVEARINTVAGEGGAGVTATTEVKIGSTVSAVSLQATPTTVPEEFDESFRDIVLLALVRDDQGQPLPGAAVNFSTQVGSLSSGGAFMTTDDAGSARDILRVTEADLNSVGGDSFQVTAEAASGEGGIQTDTADIAILRKPMARFTFNTNKLTAVFEDLSTGNPTSWTWDFGDTQSSTSQNPAHTYSAAGTYTVTLTATNAAGDGEFSRSVTVTEQ